MENPVRSSEVVQDYVGDLQQQPRGDNIGSSYPEYVAAFEFVKKGQEPGSL